MLGSCPWRTVCGHGRPHTSATDGTGACSPRATAQCRRTSNVPQTYLPTAVRHRTCPHVSEHCHRQPTVPRTRTAPKPGTDQSATNQLPAGPLVEMELDRVAVDRVAIDGVAIDLPGDCARSEADGPRQTRGARRFSPGRAIRVWLWDGSTDQTASCQWPQRPAARPIPSSAQARQ